MNHSSSKNKQQQLSAVARELETLRGSQKHDGDAFPTACRRVVMSLPGNAYCADCGSPNPSWASVSFGTLYCMQCCGRHRSYGVQTSKVRSLTMDAWNHEQVLAMLEGGNDQMRSFFDRHQMGSLSPLFSKRYHTKAAKFYRTNLSLHVQKIAKAGPYQGREASRQPRTVEGGDGKENNSQKNTKVQVTSATKLKGQQQQQTKIPCARQAAAETTRRENSFRSVSALQ